MSMVTDLKVKLTEARRAGRPFEMALLQVVLGDAATLEARQGKISDEEVEKIIRKMVAGNIETIGQCAGRPEMAEKLKGENVYLGSLLPRTLTVEEIKSALADSLEAVKGAKNDGQATGLAMKLLKGRGLKVLGDDVTAAVKQLRS